MIKINMPDNEQLIRELESEVARLKEENKELIKAVEFYSNSDDLGVWGLQANDFGDFARECLKKIQELMEE